MNSRKMFIHSHTANRCLNNIWTKLLFIHLHWINITWTVKLPAYSKQTFTKHSPYMKQTWQTSNTHRMKTHFFSLEVLHEQYMDICAHTYSNQTLMKWPVRATRPKPCISHLGYFARFILNHIYHIWATLARFTLNHTYPVRATLPFYLLMHK